MLDAEIYVSLDVAMVPILLEPNMYYKRHLQKLMKSK